MSVIRVYQIEIAREEKHNENRLKLFKWNAFTAKTKRRFKILLKLN